MDFLLTVVVPILAITFLFNGAVAAMFSDYKNRLISDFDSVSVFAGGLILHLLHDDTLLMIGIGTIAATGILGVWKLLQRLTGSELGGGDILLMGAGVFAAGPHLDTYLIGFLSATIALGLVVLVCQKRAEMTGYVPVLSDDVARMPRNPFENLASKEVPFGIPIAVAIISGTWAYGTTLGIGM